MNIYSWNINGLRAGIRRGTFQEFLKQTSPDILCLQETKTKPDQVEIDLPEYQEFWHSADRPGYSGTAIFSKIAPISVTTGFPNEILADFALTPDKFGDPLHEGRLQTAEFPEFFLINAYVPNSKRSLERLALRHNLWDPALLAYIRLLEQQKPIIICGDFNVAATALDLARPKDNQKNAGFTPEEREGMKNYLAHDLIDTFRHFYPNAARYTWWSHLAHARERGIGWRIDYFLISKKLLPYLRSAEIYEDIMGSDHCPISISIDIPDKV